MEWRSRSFRIFIKRLKLGVTYSYMSQQIPQSYGTSLDILGCEKVLCKEMMNQQQLAVMLEEHGCNGKGDEVR
ncbi:hypothetical protein MTR_4g109870 [Medicago truncatula]|uniref:Uncharacterized protein n=1 Tax=Medicago truncatula TaxID=3880 RepID=A0A072USJ3_MEDTR|nr:hypothetical protein MTR_4g109870 [Medicago truncatula]